MMTLSDTVPAKFVQESMNVFEVPGWTLTVSGPEKPFDPDHAPEAAHEVGLFVTVQSSMMGSKSTFSGPSELLALMSTPGG